MSGKDNAVQKAYQYFVKLLRTEIEHSRKTITQMEDAATQDPNSFWEQIQMLNKRKMESIPSIVLHKEGRTVTAPEQVMQTWTDAFEDLYSPQVTAGEFDDGFKQMYIANITETLMDDNTLPSDPLLLNQPITLAEIKKAVTKMKIGKATGYDRISSELLKVPKITELMVPVMNHLFETGLIPEQWLQMIVIPILKGDKNRYQPLNYRGIGLQSCLVKLYMSILNTRISTFLEKKFLCRLVDCQIGFRAKCSCTDMFLPSTVTL